jgi:hypothetical protein
MLRSAEDATLMLWPPGGRDSDLSSFFRTNPNHLLLPRCLAREVVVEASVAEGDALLERPLARLPPREHPVTSI